MKNFALLLISFIFSSVAFAQQPDDIKSTPQASPSHKASKIKKVEEPANLDGKAFKIILAAREEGKEPAKNAAETPNPSKTDIRTGKEQDKNDSKTEEGKPGENEKTNKDVIPAENFTTPPAGGSLANNKARLLFENGMVKFSTTTESGIEEEFAYKVTSGAGDFITFLASSSKATYKKSVPTDITNVPVPIDPGNLQLDKDKTIISEGISDTGNTLLGKTETDELAGKTTTSEPPAAPIASTPSAVPVASANTASANGPVYIISGFVDGKSIKGTVICKNGDQKDVYSFNGSLDKSKNGNKELGLK